MRNIRTCLNGNTTDAANVRTDLYFLIVFACICAYVRMVVDLLDSAFATILHTIALTLDLYFTLWCASCSASTGFRDDYLPCVAIVYTCRMQTHFANKTRLFFQRS